MTGTPEFAEARAVVGRTLESVAVAAESPKVEEDFALEGEFRADVAAAARYGERLAGAVAAMLERAAGDASSDGERERLGRLAAAERSHADLYRPILAAHERVAGHGRADGHEGTAEHERIAGRGPCWSGWSEAWEKLELGAAPLEGLAVFWGVAGPFLVLEAGRLAGSAYGPLSRAAAVVAQAWGRETEAGMDRVAGLSRHEPGLATAAAAAGATTVADTVNATAVADAVVVVRSALPLVRSLGETASGDVAAGWYRRGLTALEVDADLRVLAAYAESAAAALGLHGTTP